MTQVKHTMTPEEEAAFIANPFAVANRPAPRRRGRSTASAPPRTPDDHFIEAHCGLLGCEDEATETGRCVRHETIWQRLHA